MVVKRRSGTSQHPMVGSVSNSLSWVTFVGSRILTVHVLEHDYERSSCPGMARQANALFVLHQAV